MSEKGSETKFKITKKGVSKITNEGKHNDKPKTQFEFKIFCFAQLLLQILVIYENQGHIWNRLVLTFSKHPLDVQFDQVLGEIFEIKDTWYHSFIFMLMDLTEKRNIEIWRFCVKINWLNILDLLMVFLRIFLADIGTFDGEQNNFL